MINAIATALKNAIKEAFPAHMIYDEYVRQGFSRPCFFVALEKVAMKKELGNRYFVTVTWKISCYEKTCSSRGERDLAKTYHQRGMALYDVLEQDGYLVQEMRHEIVDDVLEFHLTHSFYAQKGEEREIPEKMISLKLEME